MEICVKHQLRLRINTNCVSFTFMAYYPNIKRYIDPTTDYGFKRLFENKQILIGFLNAVLPPHDTVADLSYLNQEVIGGNPEGRVVIFDLHCLTQDGRTIIVEMQRLPQPYFKRRMLYYAMRGFEHHVRRGDDSYEFAPVYVVAVVDFTLFDESPNFAHRFTLQSDGGELFSDVLQLHFLELKKYSMSQSPETAELSALEQWTAALKDMPVLDGIPDWVTDEDIKRAFEVSEVANLSPEERSKFERAIRDDIDFRGQVLQQYIYGKMKGLREGREEGREESRRDIVAGLIDKGYDAPAIANLLGWPLDEVKRFA